MWTSLLHARTKKGRPAAFSVVPCGFVLCVVCAFLTFFVIFFHSVPCLIACLLPVLLSHRHVVLSTSQRRSSLIGMPVGSLDGLQQHAAAAAGAADLALVAAAAATTAAAPPTCIRSTARCP